MKKLVLSIAVFAVFSGCVTQKKAYTAVSTAVAAQAGLSAVMYEEMMLEILRLTLENERLKLENEILRAETEDLKSALKTE